MNWGTFDDFFGTVNPFGSIATWERELDQARNARRRFSSGAAPLVDVWVSDTDVEVVAEVPGARPDLIDLKVEGQTLTIKGLVAEPDLSQEKTQSGSRYLLRERKTDEFARVIELPFLVDAETVVAHYQEGLLRITLPRHKQSMPKKIAVRVEK